MALLASLVRWTARGILLFIGIYLSLVGLVIFAALVIRWKNDTVDTSKGESYLWRINGTPPSYLFGTVHVPYDIIWPYVPENAKEALEVKFP